MPYFKTSQEWLDQSALLLEARPTTTKITTRYSIKPTKPLRAAETQQDQPKPPRAALVIKTFDPVSGVTLKYRTTKAAEVTRLVGAALGKLGRGMAALPELPDEAMEVDGPVATGGADSDAPAQQAQQGKAQATGGTGGSGKKKKKGKK